MTRQLKTDAPKQYKLKDLNKAQELKNKDMEKSEGANASVGIGMSGKGTFVVKGNELKATIESFPRG